MIYLSSSSMGWYRLHYYTSTAHTWRNYTNCYWHFYREILTRHTYTKDYFFLVIFRVKKIKFIYFGNGIPLAAFIEKKNRFFKTLYRSHSTHYFCSLCCCSVGITCTAHDYTIDCHFFAQPKHIRWWTILNSHLRRTAAGSRESATFNVAALRDSQAN